MTKDARYTSVKHIILAGRLTTIKEMFLYIPMKVVCLDMGFHYNRFRRYINDPALFNLKELERLANLIEVPVRTIIEIAYGEHEKKHSK